jgi:hypothetical protein
MAVTEGLVWIPPSDWVAFSDVGMWIEKWFRVRPADDWIQDLFSAIQQQGRMITHPVRHRVHGLTEDNVIFVEKNNRNNPVADPPGLKLSSPDHSRNGVRDIIVAEWDKSGFDNCAFTVAGCRMRDGSRSRYPIELNWIDVEQRT